MKTKMILKDKLEKLANEISNPCVTISLNTHRTHPDSDKDTILLKNLLKEAENRVVDEYGKRPAARLLERIGKIGDEIDVRYNLDSLHIFLSDKTEEVIRIAWPIAEDRVYVDEMFDLRALIKASNRVEEYLILLMSREQVYLFRAMNDSIVEEIKNEDFPIQDSPWYFKDGAERSNARLVDDIHKEFFNRMDKGLVRVAQETGLKAVVISVEENYSYLQEVADRPEFYLGHIAIDYNNIKEHQIAAQAWHFMKEVQKKRRKDAIEEVKESVSQGLMITDLQEIYQAAIDGRGDLLVVYEDFSQPVLMMDERTFKRVDDPSTPDAVDDITSTIAWDVMSKGGKVFFTCQEDMKELGEIALKARY